MGLIQTHKKLQFRCLLIGQKNIYLGCLGIYRHRYLVDGGDIFFPASVPLREVFLLVLLAIGGRSDRSKSLGFLGSFYKFLRIGIVGSSWFLLGVKGVDRVRELIELFGGFRFFIIPCY
jgi:hypothetical protein